MSSEFKANECQVCCKIESKVGWYYGAVVCEACKKFFTRSENTKSYSKYKCIHDQQCLILHSDKFKCKYCRYMKCKQLGMDIKHIMKHISMHIPKEICSVCTRPTNSIHFGVLACEACKSFFSRCIRSEKYRLFKCRMKENCSITQMNYMCKHCRYQKCLQVGMSIEKSVMGRPSNNSLIDRAYSITGQKRKHSLEEYQIQPQLKRLKHDDLDELNTEFKNHDKHFLNRFWNCDSIDSYQNDAVEVRHIKAEHENSNGSYSPFSENSNSSYASFLPSESSSSSYDFQFSPLEFNLNINLRYGFVNSDEPNNFSSLTETTEYLFNYCI